MKIKLLVVVAVSVFGIESCSKQDANGQIETKHTPELEVDKITGIARIEPEKGLLTLYANANGRISEIEAKENELVAKDDILLTLDNTLDKALLDVEESKIPVQNSVIEVSKHNSTLIKEDLDKSIADYLLNEKLYAAKAITQQALNESKLKWEKLKIDYAKAVADEIHQKDKLKEVQANVHYQQAIANNKQLHAVYAGKVLQWEVHVGDYVTQGQQLGQFAPKGDLVAVTEVDELFQDKVKVGMQAEVLSQVNGVKLATGTVVYVADFLKKKSLFSDDNTVEDRRVKVVKVLLNNNSKAIINSKVDCAISLK